MKRIQAQPKRNIIENKRAKKRHLDRAVPRAMIDALEPRQMLALIVGTPNNDTISISASGSTTHVVVNGTDNPTTDLAITVFGGLGNDLISIASTRSGSSMTVDGSGDNDVFQNTVSDLDAVYLGNITVIGGNGTDILFADNGTDSMSNGTIDIQSGSIVKNTSDTLINYTQLERLDFADNDFANRIDFINLQGPTHDITNVTVRGHGGNDTIANYRSGLSAAGFWQTSIGTGGVFVDAGTGSDT